MKKRPEPKKINKVRAGLAWDQPWVFELAMDILILVILFLMPVIFDRRLGIVFSGTKTAFMRLFGLLALSIWSIKLLVTGKHRFIRTPLDWPVLTFLLCATIAAITSIHVYVSFAGFYGRYEGLTSWYLFGLFFFVVTNFVRSADQLKRMIVTVASGATLMSVYSILQRWGIDPYMWGGVPTKERVIGMIGQPNFLAAYILMAFFLMLAYLLVDKKDEERAAGWSGQLLPVLYFLSVPVFFLLMIYNLEAYNVFLWYSGMAALTGLALLFSYQHQRLPAQLFDLVLVACLTVNYTCILFTQSRGGYMGLFTALTLFFLIAGREQLFRHWRKIALVGGLIVLVTLVTISQPGYSPFERFGHEITTEKVEAGEEAGSKLELKGAAGSRGETWKSAAMIIADNPLFGIGPEVLKMVFPRYETDLFRFKETFHVKQDRCHNETFDVPVTKGLLALGAFLWIIFVFFRTGWRKAVASGGETRILLAGMLAAALAFLIQNQFSFGVVAITSLFWIIWAMVMVIGEPAPKDEGKKTINWLGAPWFAIAAVLLAAALLAYFSFFSFRGDIWFKSGKTKMEMRRFQEAVVDLQVSLGIFPLEGSTVSHLGISYLNLSNFQPGERQKHIGEAIKVFRYGTRIDPYNADNFFLLAKIYLMLGDIQAAEMNASIALRIDPYYAEVYQLVGLIRERQGRLDEAAANFERTFSINPNLREAMLQLEQLNLRRGRAGETLPVLEKVLKKYGGFTRDIVPLTEQVARYYINQGRAAEARKLGERLIKIDQKAPVGYLVRAMAAARLGDNAAAVQDLQQVLFADPKNLNARLELGRLYLVQGDRQRAQAELEQVLRIDPNQPQARELMRRL